MSDTAKKRAYGDPGLGAFIREARRFRRVSRLDLARAAGVSEQLVGKIECGQRNATPAVRDAIAAKLGITFPETDELAEAIQRLTEAYTGRPAA